jgi:TusE/DsrC/DsvC family sulfur relay protein
MYGTSGAYGYGTRGVPVHREILGRKILFDKEGFIWNPEEWTEEIAVVLAKEMGLEQITDTHWKVIRFLRDYFFYHGRAPLNRDIKAGTGLSLLELETLFPEGIRKGARRVAGLRNPRSCSG